MARVNEFAVLRDAGSGDITRENLQLLAYWRQLDSLLGDDWSFSATELDDGMPTFRHSSDVLWITVNINSHYVSVGTLFLESPYDSDKWSAFDAVNPCDMAVLAEAMTQYARTLGWDRRDLEELAN